MIFLKVVNVPIVVKNLGSDYMLEVVKRTGKVVPFDRERIVKAVTKAYQEVYPNDPQILYADKIADAVEDVAQQYDSILTVEEIQDLVEDYLTDYDRLVAKAYIKYRYKRGVMNDEAICVRLLYE